VRALVETGDFLEIYCHCPIEVCEQRDVKGLYAKARAGEIKEFTGVSSAYEPPTVPELVLNTSSQPLDACVDKVIALLHERGIVKR
jgi:adenylylsulfate kinase